MKILIGIILVLLVGLGLTGWQLRAAWNTQGQLETALAGAAGALAVATKQNETLNNRFDTLDRTLVGLNVSQQQNQVELKTRLNTLTTIVKETGDTDESIACLHQPVPAQLDRWLRDPVPAAR